MSVKTPGVMTHDCFAGLTDLPSLLLAVSGGPDSMALLHLAARWAKPLGTSPALHVATVDHGLRPAAADEAALVAAEAAALALPHAILHWTGPKPTSRLHERARAARYDLLGAHARRIGVSHILTAHHADDQAETVLFRLGRGSGLSGLAGMRRLTPLLPDLWLCRPLLGLAKADLVAFCDAEGIPYAEDPSNHDAAFARARLRQHAPALAELGIDAWSLGRFARRMSRADDALQAMALRAETALDPSMTPGVYRADLATAGEIEPEIALRVLRRAIAHVVSTNATGTGRIMRLDRLESLTENLRTALRAGAAHRATLAGARVVLDVDGKLAITREPRRRRGQAPNAASFDRLD